MNKNKHQWEILRDINILYVEDDKEIQQQLSLFLRAKVGVLCTAFDGQEGLESYRRNKPDIIITDIRMPVMGGLEMVKTIRKIDQDIPIIITTAFNEPEFLLKSIDLGINKFMLKPINPYLLLDTLIECINHPYSTSGGHATGHRHL